MYIYYRRADREPNSNSRVCSCHFRDGDKRNDPEIFKWNSDKLFPSEPEVKRKKTKKQIIPSDSLEESPMEQAGPSTSSSVNEIILQSELRTVSEELSTLRKEQEYAKRVYTVHNSKENELCMETGIPTKKVFWIIAHYAQRFENNISYYLGWKVEGMKFEDQILITLMKLRQNYTNLHLAQLFSCSEATISNIFLTFLHVLHSLFFKDIMQRVPSKEKNKLTSPASFLQFPNCRMVMYCTDFEIAVPKQKELQKATYSFYRGMNSFKVLIGISSNAAMTYVSNLYPGSTSDRIIVENSGILHNFMAGDLILADKGFLVADILPAGVSINVPPFLEHGKFTKSEIIATKQIANCRIHVERANARIKDFKILSYIPAKLRSHADKIVQLVAALVNFQFPLIKECNEGTQFDSQFVDW